MGQVKVQLTFDVEGDEAVAARVFGYHQNYHRFWGRKGTDPAGKPVDYGDYGAELIAIDVNPGEVEGFTNYETFIFWVFYSQDAERDGHCLERVRAVLARASLIAADISWPRLAITEWLEQSAEKLLALEERQASARNDLQRLQVALLAAAHARVNWREIAECYITRVTTG